MIFPELPIEERIRGVAAAGFDAIEFWDWRTRDLAALASLCAGLGIAVTTMSGQRAGSLVDSRDFTLYRDQVVASIEAAHKVSCPNLMLLTNPLDSGGHITNAYPDISPQEKRENCVHALSELAPLAVDGDITLLVEPLNTIIDHPGYWLDGAGVAFEIIRAVDSPRVRVLYDLYHMQAMEQDVQRDIEENLNLIGYVHAADYPGRHEPGTGDMDYPSILRLLDELGYHGTVGFEFSPAGSSEDALRTIHALVAPLL
jgi:hydroxypyruvate isomerase